MSEPTLLTLFDESAEESVLTLCGEIDLTTMARFEEVMQGTLSRRPERLIIDLSATDFISVQGIVALGLYRQHVGTLVLRGASPVIQRVLEKSGLLNDIVVENLRPLPLEVCALH